MSRTKVDKRCWSLTEKEAYFENYREALIREARKLTGFITIYRQLNDVRKDRLAELNVAPAFFTTIEYSLFSNIIVWSHKLFDNDEECSLPRFLSDMKHMTEIFTLECKKRRRPLLKDGDYGLSVHEDITREHIKEDRKKIADLRQNILQSIALRRNKYHAHFDEAYFFDPNLLDDEAPVTLNGFDKVDDTVSEIFNRYSAAYDGNMHIFRSLNLTDLSQVLDDLHYNGRYAVRWSEIEAASD